MLNFCMIDFIFVYLPTLIITIQLILASNEEMTNFILLFYMGQNFVFKQAMQLVVNLMQREDSEQSFWGDNEQESTSSENDMSTQLCIKCKKKKQKIGKFCENCVQVSILMIT